MGLVVVVSVLHTISCGDRAGSGSPGVLQSWDVSDDPIAAIGGTDEREGYLLHHVAGVTRLADGRIVVLNASSHELKYYDAEGKHLFNAGGQGDGPGELRMWPESFTRLPGDSILVLSPVRGLTRFGPAGEYVTSRPVNLPWPADWACRSSEGGRHLLADGSILMLLDATVYSGGGHGPGCPKPSVKRAMTLIVRYVAEAGELDTVSLAPGPEDTFEAESRYAYAKDLVFAIARDRVYVGDTGSDTILVMGLTGDTITTLPVPFESLPVPADAMEKLSEDVEYTGGGLRYTLTTTFVYPNHYPGFGRLVAGPEEELWVMAYPPAKEPFHVWELTNPAYSGHLDDGGARWRVVGRDGRSIAELRTPPGFFLVEVGADYILGVSKDDLDRESVEVYALIRR